MAKYDLAELTAFLAVAKAKNFTHAAAELGVSTSNLSQKIRNLEEELGVRLLNRTTRSVAPTEAGERLRAALAPALASVDHAIEGLNEFRASARGSLRLCVARMAAVTILAPLIARFLRQHPGIDLEVAVSDTHCDIVSERFDAGIRIGEWLDQDMIAVKISDGFPLVAVASPAYLARHAPPADPADLHTHDCIRVRFPWDGTIRRWEFEKDGHRVDIPVTGQLLVNDLDLALSAALDDMGIAYLPQQWAQPFIDAGRLVPLLEEWSLTLSGFFLYYSSRRQMPPALRAFIRFIRQTRRSLRLSPSAQPRSAAMTDALNAESEKEPPAASSASAPSPLT